MTTVNEKIQDKLFEKILKKPGNQTCSDCPAKSPGWVSLDFGVFICMNCSGAHRALGPTITRVRSTKLDSWNLENIEKMDAMGNQKANSYFESGLTSQQLKPSIDAELSVREKFVYDKYVKKLFVNKNAQNAVPQEQKQIKEDLIDLKEDFQEFIEVEQKKEEFVEKQEVQFENSQPTNTFNIDKLKALYNQNDCLPTAIKQQNQSDKYSYFSAINQQPGFNQIPQSIRVLSYQGQGQMIGVNQAIYQNPQVYMNPQSYNEISQNFQKAQPQPIQLQARNADDLMKLYNQKSQY